MCILLNFKFSSRERLRGVENDKTFGINQKKGAALCIGGIDNVMNIYLIDKGDGTANAYQRPVTSATITENAVILAVSAQDGLEAKNYAGTHTIRLGFMPIFESKCATTGNWQGNLRLVINKSTSPLVMTANQLASMKVYVFLEHKVSGETKWLETTVESITERNANEYNVQVYPSTDVPGKGIPKRI